MMNWKLFAIASASMLALVTAAACSSSDSGDDASGGAGGGDDSSIGGAAGAADTGGAAGAVGGTIADQLYDDSADGTACKACLATNCAAETTACGANNESCSDVSDCIQTALTPADGGGGAPDSTLDCAVSHCIGVNTQANDFFTCVATNCAAAGCGVDATFPCDGE